MEDRTHLEKELLTVAAAMRLGEEECARRLR
jgi:hypothetical protein